jgi:hypothetical protein
MSRTNGHRQPSQE